MTTDPTSAPGFGTSSSFAEPGVLGATVTACMTTSSREIVAGWLPTGVTHRG
jgi:hypothetical protein